MIIGLVGERLAGKDLVATYLKENYGAAHVRHSHILDDVLRILDLPISRRNEIDLGMGLRQSFGIGILNKALRKRVKDSTAKLTVINGMRFQEELDNARELGATIIYITAPENMLYERFKNRQEKSDDGSMSLEEFRKLEQEPTEIGIPKLGQQADIRIDNTGSIGDLYRKVDEVIEQLKITKS